MQAIAALATFFSSWNRRCRVVGLSLSQWLSKEEDAPLRLRSCILCHSFHPFFTPPALSLTSSSPLSRFHSPHPSRMLYLAFFRACPITFITQSINVSTIQQLIPLLPPPYPLNPLPMHLLRHLLKPLFLLFSGALIFDCLDSFLCIERASAR